MRDLNQIAEQSLDAMTSMGFENAQVSVGIREQDELNIAHDEASLLRSTEDYSIELMGIVDGRKAATSLTDLTEDNVRHNITDLFERAKLAPQDEANAVSADQTANIEKGPQTGDLDLLVLKIRELLDYRAANTPKMKIEEGAAAHILSRGHIMTSEGSVISTSIGCYSLSVMGTASEGDQSSSFAYTGGSTDDLSTHHAKDFFAIEDLLKDTENQIHTQQVESNFVGDVVLAPTAVTDLVGWLLGQLSDGQLIADSSVYKDHVGEIIASPLLTIRSRFDGPGHCAITGDAFIADPVTVVDEGRLTTLLPSLYGSRKTGIAHRPASAGWQVCAGESDKSELIADAQKGALVGRLSMGSPGANGDFSGVIKNSFAIRDGALGPALSETMISGNVAQMLKDISGISKEHIDDGGQDLPWMRISGLHFS